MDSREDLANAAVLVEMARASRTGQGGSWVTHGQDDAFRPRWRRWQIVLSDNEMEYARQLDALGIQLVAIWRDPPGIRLYSHFSTKTPPSSSQEIPRDSLIMRGGLLDYDLLERAGMPAAPQHIVRVLPQNLENNLAISEFKFAKNQGLKVEDIEQTSFAVRTVEDKYLFEVTGQVPKSKSASSS